MCYYVEKSNVTQSKLVLLQMERTGLSEVHQNPQGFWEKHTHALPKILRDVTFDWTKSQMACQKSRRQMALDWTKISSGGPKKFDCSDLQTAARDATHPPCAPVMLWIQTAATRQE
mmetsp:Transcript_15603/g.30697  ORF Transcript_15603/g.30697 Transcript_15603/m.30697 type:complete len:116 (+) Transcript_15603:596-943(+)